MAPVRKRNKNEVRRALYAWIAWTPLLALFVVMAMDTSLSLKARSIDYEFGKLAAQRRQTTAELDRVRSVEAQWSDVSKVSEIIARLNMLLPDPRQIQVVIAHPDTPMPMRQEGPRDAELEMASTPYKPVGGPSQQTVVTAPAVPFPVLASAPSSVPVVTGPVQPVETPAAAAPAALVPVNTSMMVSAATVAVASRPAARTATAAKVLDLPKEQITDLDSPDTPTNDLLSNL